MRNAILGLLAGCVLTAIVFVFGVIPHCCGSCRAVGESSGVISARWQATDQIVSTLSSDLQPGDRERPPLFSVKTRDVVVVERKGVKTLRVVE